MKWLLLLGLVACVDRGPEPQRKIDRKLLQTNIVKTVPDALEHMDVAFGYANYVGNAGASSVIPGQPVTITHYWQVVLPPGPDWRVFAQVRGDPGTADFMNLDATDMELAHPVEDWRAGEVIVDPQTFVLRPDWKSKTATLFVGIIRDNGHEIGDRMAAYGPHTLDRAVVAKQFSVDLSKAPPPPGTIYISRATGPIAIDGVANEPAWTAIPWGPDFVTAEGSQDPAGSAKAKMTWDDDNLYAFVTVVDPDIVSPYKQHDDHLWNADAVELFIDADGNHRGYIELQVNPNNATFDAWFKGTRADGPGDDKWDSNMRTEVKLRGTTEPNDVDQGWDVEIAIPWAAVKGRDDEMKVNTPPHVGDRWRLNIVRTNQRTGGKNQAEGGASSWNKINQQDFHALDKMLTAVFADATGSITPPK
ncbi:MAG: carbohydrate-binding family 9-like protein [Kofleriaceae bacterium]